MAQGAYNLQRCACGTWIRWVGGFGKRPPCPACGDRGDRKKLKAYDQEFCSILETEDRAARLAEEREKHGGNPNIPER